MIEGIAAIQDLLICAKKLLEPGEEHLNPEYTRALIELCTEAAGLPQDDKQEVAAALGIPKDKIKVILEGEELCITHWVNTEQLSDPDDIDMNSWENDKANKQYFSALHEDEQMTYPWSLLARDMCFYERNSFEFNRRPKDYGEVFEVIAGYLGTDISDQEMAKAKKAAVESKCWIEQKKEGESEVKEDEEDEA